jgi:uncharacterized protein YdhG (YjbR/CyaY superfamily)
MRRFAMAGKKTADPKPARPKTAAQRSSFSAEERAAMRERARELKAQASRADGEQELVLAIARMAEPDRGIAERVHALIRGAAPELAPRTWYGMPAYARDGNVICFFQNAGKFKARYQTLGFSDRAHLDQGEMWPTTFAITELTPAAEARIVALVQQAVS